MPHTNRKSNVPPPFKPASFVNIQLSKEQAALCKASEWSIDHQDNALRDLFDAGYKLTCRFDTKNQCFAAWLIGPQSGVNSGLILAGRGSTASKSVKMVCFIHFAVLQKEWGADFGLTGEELDD